MTAYTRFADSKETVVDRPRIIAPLALLITVAAVCYTAAVAVTGWLPGPGWLVQAVMHVGELLVVLALARTAAGQGAVARTGLAAAALGQATLAAAEVLWPQDAGLADLLFSVGPLLTGVGLIVAGTAVARGHRLAGRLRFAPAAVGAYVFAVLIPVLIGSGGPPAPAALWAIAGWDVLWAISAFAALGAARAPAAVPAAAAR